MNATNIRTWCRRRLSLHRCPLGNSLMQNASCPHRRSEAVAEASADAAVAAVVGGVMEEAAVLEVAAAVVR